MLVSGVAQDNLVAGQQYVIMVDSNMNVLSVEYTGPGVVALTTPDGSGDGTFTAADEFGRQGLYANPGPWVFVPSTSGGSLKGTWIF